MTNLQFPNASMANLRKFRNGQTIAYKTTIEWNADKTVCGIYHHNSLIAVIDESGKTGHARVVSVSVAGHHTKTTTHRLARILSDNTRGYYSARIVGGITHLTCTQSHYTGGGVYNVFSGHRFISIVCNEFDKTTGIYPGNIVTDESLYNGISV